MMTNILNLGQREWTLIKGGETIGPGETKLVDSAVAEKYATDYPRDFRVLVAPVAEKPATPRKPKAPKAEE